MKKNYFPLIEISGPELEIRAFVDREIVRWTTSDYQFIKTFTMSRELRDLLNYQCKIFNEPEIENEMATKIERQRINGNFEAKPELNLFVGQYTNKYLNLMYENIKILKQGPTEMEIAIGSNSGELHDVWKNYLLSEYKKIEFKFSETEIEEGIPRYKSNLIISHGYYTVKSELISDDEEGLNNNEFEDF
jgi:hypothetical protein